MIDMVHAVSPHRNKSETIRMLVRAGIAQLYPEVFAECTGVKLERSPSNNQTIVSEPQINIKLGLTDNDLSELGVSKPAEDKPATSVEDILKLINSGNKKPDDEREI
jgi:hypothetical protein